jgi:hypothetical protein
LILALVDLAFDRSFRKTLEIEAQSTFEASRNHYLRQLDAFFEKLEGLKPCTLVFADSRDWQLGSAWWQRLRDLIEYGLPLYSVLIASEGGVPPSQLESLQKARSRVATVEFSEVSKWKSADFYRRNIRAVWSLRPDSELSIPSGIAHFRDSVHLVAREANASALNEYRESPYLDYQIPFPKHVRHTHFGEEMRSRWDFQSRTTDYILFLMSAPLEACQFYMGLMKHMLKEVEILGVLAERPGRDAAVLPPDIIAVGALFADIGRIHRRPNCMVTINAHEDPRLRWLQANLELLRVGVVDIELDPTGGLGGTITGGARTINELCFSFLAVTPPRSNFAHKETNLESGALRLCAYQQMCPDGVRP